MVMRLSSLRTMLWVITILLVVMAFPLQVLSGNPYPSLLPYVVFGMILVVDEFFGVAAPEALRGRSLTAQIVAVYVALVVFDGAWQVAGGLVAPGEVGASFVNYLLPVSFFWYFRRRATEREIRAVLVAIVIGGALVAAYFAYDSFAKLALGRITSYARQAAQYSMMRANLTEEEANSVRLALGYRSFGLLESHTVSAIWVIFGAIASVVFVPTGRLVLRRTILVAFGTLLLMGLNFTSILTFVIVMITFEFGGNAVLRGRLSGRAFRDVVALGIALLLVALIGLQIAGEVMGRFIGQNLTGQVQILLGSSQQQFRAPEVLMTNIKDYFITLTERPWMLVVGDGYTSYGGAKGGDVGHKETLMRLGLPLYAATLAGLIVMAVRGDRDTRFVATESDQSRRFPFGFAVVHFAVCLVFVVVLMEVHYSVWGAKAVLPILMFAAAMLDRRAVLLGETT